MTDEIRKYDQEFSDKGFWDKVLKFAKTAGKEVIEKALLLYYALDNPELPAWAKSTIYGALGYFIFPLDAIPDVTPVVGYADDLGVLTVAIAAVALYIDKTVKDKANAKLIDWFGE